MTAGEELLVAIVVLRLGRVGPLPKSDALYMHHPKSH